MAKAIFLDRDGTINVEKHYLYRIEEFEFLPGVIEGLRLLQDAGYLLIIITNQSGIGRGFYTEESFKKLNSWMKAELEKQGVCISNVYYCPHLPDAKVGKYRKVCDCRKPALGLYERAVNDYDVDLNSSYAIGDKIRDCSICEGSDCKGFLIGSNESAQIIDAVRAGECRNIRYMQDLLCAAREIVKGEII